MITHEEHSLFQFSHLGFHLSRELKEFYAFVALRGFAVNLIAIFEPIYIYLFFGKSLPITFLFLAVRYLSFGMLVPFAEKVINRIGIKHTILISTPFLFLYYVGLWKIDSLGSFAWLLPIVVAVSSALYWPAYHIYFTKYSDSGKRGREMGFRTIILSLVAAVSPLVGGFMLTILGFPFLFLAVLVFLFSAVVPLFLSKEIYEKNEDKYYTSIKMIFNPKYIKETVAFFSSGIEGVIQLFAWPLFLFLAAINFEAIGAITSVAILIGVIFAYYVGKAIDVVGTRKLLFIGVFLNALFWPFKFFVSTPFDAFLANILHRLGRGANYLPFGTIFYEWASENEENIEKFVIYREVVVNFSRGVALVILSILFMYEFNIRYTFILAAVLSFGMLFIINRPKEILFSGVTSKIVK